MHNLSNKYISTFFIVITLIAHGAISLVMINQEKKSDNRVSLKIKKMRRVGEKNSKIDKDIIAPKDKKREQENIFKMFEVTQKVTQNKSMLKQDEIKSKASSIKKADAKQRSRAHAAQSEFIQQKLMREAVQKGGSSNPLLQKVSYNVKFLPPKGIAEDELNELEKVFYSFYKRIAIKYINSVNASILGLIDEKPYMQEILQNQKPSLLTAVIRYDHNGNAELIKIINSSENDEIHGIFEEILKKMDKIPNIAKSLIDRDGKYTAYFQIGLNN